VLVLDTLHFQTSRNHQQKPMRMKSPGSTRHHHRPPALQGRLARAASLMTLARRCESALWAFGPTPTLPAPQARDGRRQHRRWATAWSPGRISTRRLLIDFPEDESMRISHEAIDQALYVQGRGALRRELVVCLRTARALRVPRGRSRGRCKKFVSPEIMINQRPPEANERAVPEHWEGDLILGLESSAIGTLVERSTRFTMLLHLPRMGEPAVCCHDSILSNNGASPAIPGRFRELGRSGSPWVTLGRDQREHQSAVGTNPASTHAWRRKTGQRLGPLFPNLHGSRNGSTFSTSQDGSCN
jgi:hypothetical protein